MLAALRDDFSRLERPAYHLVGTFTPHGAFARLLGEIGDGTLDRAIGQAFGLDFAALPRMRGGHTPYIGKRRVVQVTWLRDADAAARKEQMGRLAWWLKGLFRR
jgi:hypothetical protein